MNLLKDVKNRWSKLLSFDINSYTNVQSIAEVIINDLSKLRKFSKVYIYPGCDALNIIPGIVHSTISSLNYLGIESLLYTNEFHCCGLPLLIIGKTSAVLHALLVGSTIAYATKHDADAIVTYIFT